MAGSQPQEKGPGDYARDALSEWGQAVRYGARAVAARLQERRASGSSVGERLNPAKTEKGGRLGDVADTALAKFGKPGKALSKVSLGSRIVERVRGGGDGSPGESRPSGVSGSNGHDRATAVPIAESINVALPVLAVYSLATRFEEYPEFLDRAVGAEKIDDSHITFVTKLHGRERELAVEIGEVVPNKRIEWECVEEIEHVGVISFHELAPALTHVEVTVELEAESLLDRLARSTHLTERAVRDELHRFKAHAELSEEAAEAYVTEAADDSEEPAGEEEREDEEEPVDEEELEEEPVDEEELEEEPVDEEELEDEPVDEEELEDDEELEEEPVDEEELEEEPVDEEELEDEELVDEPVDEEELEEDLEDEDDLEDEEEEDFEDEDVEYVDEDVDEEELEPAR